MILPTLVQTWACESPAFLHAQSANLFVTQFSGNPFANGSISVLLNVNINSSQPNFQIVAPSTILYWPNEMTNLPGGANGFALGDGFLPPGKSTGSVSVLKWNSQLSSFNVTKLTIDKADYFYHKAVFVDVNNDGKLDILTARAYDSVFTGGKGELIWLEAPQWTEHFLIAGPDINFDVHFLATPNAAPFIVYAAEFFGERLTAFRIESGGTISQKAVIDKSLGRINDVRLVDLNNSGRVNALLVTDYHYSNAGGLYAYTLGSLSQPSSFVRSTIYDQFHNVQYGAGSGAPGFIYVHYATTAPRVGDRPNVFVSGDGAQAAYLFTPKAGGNLTDYDLSFSKSYASTVGAMVVNDWQGRIAQRPTHPSDSLCVKGMSYNKHIQSDSVRDDVVPTKQDPFAPGQQIIVINDVTQQQTVVVVQNETRWRDFLFVVAFWLNLLAWIGVCVAARMLPEVPAFDLIDENTVFSYSPVVLVVGAFAAVLAAIANALAFRFPRVYGFVAIIFEMIFIAGYMIWFCVTQYADTYLIIVTVIVELVLLWTLYNFYKYIDFAEQLVVCVRTVASTHKGNYTALIGGMLVLIAWVFAWAFGSMSVLAHFQVAETIRNVTHVTVAGSHAAWYFQGEGPRAHNPTLSAFRRAATYSFGSICFGSLLVAILQTLKRILQMMRFQNSRNAILLVLSILARLLLYVIEAALRFFNKYIFVIVAITGDTYINSAKTALRIFGEHGFEMVMQNNIVVSMIGATSIVAALAGAGVGYGIGAALNLNVYGALVIGLLIAVFIVEGSFVLLESGSMSVLMCYIMQPDKLRLSNPVLFELLSGARGTPVAQRNMRGQPVTGAVGAVDVRKQTNGGKGTVTY